MDPQNQASSSAAAGDDVAGSVSQSPITYNECQEAVKRLTDYLSHELGPDEQVRVQRHLHVCRGCFAKFHFEETLLRTIRERIQTVHAPDALRAKILGLISHTTTSTTVVSQGENTGADIG